MSELTLRDGTTLYYEDLGRGRPLLLVHGWPLSGAMWEYQVEPLVRSGFRCITYDRRGFGRSGKPASGYDYATMAEDMAELIARLDLRDLTLVGFSMGGGKVVEYLAKHQSEGRVARAVLVGSIIPFLLKTDDNPDGVDGQAFKDMQAGLRKDRPAFLTSFTETFFGVGLLSSPVSPPMHAASCEVAMQASPIATLACIDAFGRTDFRDKAKTITVPTLIIHGDADAIVPIGISAQLAAELIPNAELEIYEGAPHGLFFTHKDELAADLAAFASEGTVVLDPAAE